MAACVLCRRSNLRDSWLPFVLIAVLSCTYFATLRDGHDWGGDFSLYIAHARNLATGAEYGDTGYLYSRRNPFVSPPTYPPGFPLMLAPVVAAVGIDFAFLKGVCVSTFAAALPIGFAALRGHLHRSERVTWILLLGLSPYLWNFRQSILSDLPFMMFVLATLGMAGPRRGDSSVPRPGWHGAVCGCLMGCAMVTRTIGFMLPVSLVVAAFVRQGPDRRFVVRACAVACGLVLAQRLALPRDGAYVDQLLPYGADPGVIPVMVAVTLQGWWRGWMMMWSSSLGMTVAAPVAVVILLLVIAGFVCQIRTRGWSTFEIFAAGYLAVVLVWPMAQDPRFLVPVLPLLTAYLLVASRFFIARLAPRRHRRLCMHAVALALILHVSSGTLTVAGSSSPPGITDEVAVRLFDFLVTDTAPDAVLVAAKPRVIALMTGRRSAALVRPEDFQKHADEIGATHLVLAGLPAERFMGVKALLDAHAGQWPVVYREEGSVVYWIRPTRTEPGSAAEGMDR